jgi:AraC family transcriptional regulator
VLKGNQDRYAQRILRVLIYIQDHLDEALSLRELADVANVSPYHFHRIFRGMVGEPVLEHVRRLRLERAAHDLTNTEHGVSRIAFDAGYETHEAFTRAFKSAFSASPSAYRKNQRAQRPDSPSNVHYLTDRDQLSFDPLTEGVGPMKVELVTRDEQRVVFVRHIGPYEEVGVAWEKLMTFAVPRGLMRNACFGHSYDDPDVTDSAKLRYDACIVVDDEVKPEGEVGVQTITGGTFAKFRHTGSYHNLSTTYAAFFERWLPTSGYEAGKLTSIEEYQNDPRSTPEDQLETDIYIALTRE